ncbi:prepilin-type N-terminal cleavage/methylation domain-containing protein [Candidatus Azambacteria bacterium]|nr:prepilin-type N-terminal cleavage/methylation domain-containing protein [Candidatus Azambacteria bacterium]
MEHKTYNSKLKVSGFKFQDSSFRFQESGFTLIEIVIAIGVLAIIGATLFIGFSTATESADLKTSAFKVVDALQFARTRTIASLASSQYGVHFEQTQYVLFRGATYNASDPDNIIYALPSRAEIANIALMGGGSDVVFDRITGKTAQNGTLTVRLIADPSKLKTIEVAVSGRADISADALPPGGTRVSDTRHVHFTYAQGIQSGVTLMLNFPGFLTQNIDFQSYWDGSAFDWSGTVIVNGSNQVLRIHTHAATGSSADFSVTRDMRYNNAALEISLDGQSLVNYAADGAVTQGTSLWASAPAAQ